MTRSWRTAFFIFVLFCVAACEVHNKELARDDIAPLEGLWVWQADAKPAQVKLDVKRSSEGWSAQVNGIDVNIEVKDERISAKLDNQESFTGSLSEDGNFITGYWVQPQSDLAYSNMTTRFSLPRSGTDKWSGEVNIQPRPFHVFLDVFKTDDGAYAAVIRNPERNDILGATRYQVSASDQNTWLLSATRGERIIEIPIALAQQGTLHMRHNRLDDVLALTAATPEQKRKYVSRVGNIDEATYTTPKDLDDGWKVTSASNLGVDESMLAELTTKLANADPRDPRPNLIHSMLVAYKGTLIYEEYFYGHDAEDVHDTRSLAKVFGSVMVGAMRQQGHKIDPQATPLADLLGEALIQPESSLKQSITLAHLMTYTSGLDCDFRYQSMGSEDRMWAQDNEPDFWLYTAQLPLLHNPGERYAYCSGSSNLVGQSIHQHMKVPVFDAFDLLIAQPLQFSTYHWNLMLNGEGYLGGGVYMRPRDILKIGAVYAGGGQWNGRSIVSPQWIEESTSTKIDITPATTGMTDEEFNNNYFGGGQAYIWRTDKVVTPTGEFSSYEATGNGGQILLVVPELDLSVVFTGGNYFMGYIWGKWRNDIVGQYVIPAIKHEVQQPRKQ